MSLSKGVEQLDFCEIEDLVLRRAFLSHTRIETSSIALEEFVLRALLSAAEVELLNRDLLTAWKFQFLYEVKNVF